MLADQHRELLATSAISDEVAEARGYWSATNKRELVEFAAVQRRVPALVIPQHNVLGEEAHSMIRPDEPRERDGKAVKYETPSKARQVLDVNPLAQPMLDDPAIPLIVTEGSRKADSAASRGMCALSINGVWGWRGTNAKSGKTALPDWNLVALNGRTVLLAFDDDAMRNPKVHQALGALAGFLGMKRAEVGFVMFPPNVSGAKVGLDDFLAAHPDAGFAELAALAVEALPDAPREPGDTFSDVEPEWGWVVLGEVRDVLVRYVWFPSAGLADAVALWVAHTHQLDVIDFTPRLHIRSPMKRSGKSRLLEVVKLLVPKPMQTMLVTPAVLYRSIEALRPTLLIDEVDRQLSREAATADDAIIAVLNGGYERSGTVHRNVGTAADMTVKEFPVFAAVAMAGIGFIADTVADRSITIRLERRPPGEPVTDFRQRQARASTRALARRLAAWSARHAESIGAARPISPKGLNDRAADIWEPLLAIADAAGGTWPERARDIAVSLSTIADAEDVDSTTELQLLADIRETWPAHIDRRFSAEIVAALKMLDGRPWADFGHGSGVTTNWLARKLKQFGIQPTKLRIGPETKQGYYEDAFVEPWERYGITDVSPSHGPSTTGTNGTDGTDQVTVTRDVPVVPDVPVVEGARDEDSALSNGDIPGATHTFHRRKRSG